MEKNSLHLAVEKQQAEQIEKERSDQIKYAQEQAEDAANREVSELVADAKLNIHQRILAVMGEIGYVRKDRTVKIKSKRTQQEFEYQAVSHDMVTAELHQLFVKYRIVARRTVVDHTPPAEKQVTTVLTVLSEYINADDPSDKLDVTTVGYGDDYNDKGPGKAFSYAVKYADLKTFMLETGEDEESRLSLTGKTITPEKASHLARLAEKAGVETSEIKQYLLDQNGVEVESFGQIPANLYMSILTLIENRAKGRGDD